jgi:hypothetical protein
MDLLDIGMPDQSCQCVGPKAGENEIPGESHNNCRGSEEKNYQLFLFPRKMPISIPGELSQFFNADFHSLDLYLFNTKSHVPLFAQHQIGL